MRQNNMDIKQTTSPRMVHKLENEQKKEKIQKNETSVYNIKMNESNYENQSKNKQA